jgi:hypothetical protein
MSLHITHPHRQIGRRRRRRRREMEMKMENPIIAAALVAASIIYPMAVSFSIV